MLPLFLLIYLAVFILLVSVVIVKAIIKEDWGSDSSRPCIVTILNLRLTSSLRIHVETSSMVWVYTALLASDTSLKLIRTWSVWSIFAYSHIHSLNLPLTLKSSAFWIIDTIFLFSSFSFSLYRSYKSFRRSLTITKPFLIKLLLFYIFSFYKFRQLNYAIEFYKNLRDFINQEARMGVGLIFCLVYYYHWVFNVFFA